jgi:hypothetical protein
VSQICNNGVTTSNCACNWLCGCGIFGCFQGPCQGASTNGSYQVGCTGV